MTVRDPVCGMEIEPQGAFAKRDHMGQTFYFCSQSCVEQFDKDPVCGKRIHRGKADITIEYKGVNYFLCCPQCQPQFERPPKNFARPELGEKARKVQHYPVKQHN